MVAKIKKQSVGCRVQNSKVTEIDTAADAAGMSRAEWISQAIDKALGGRPRHTLKSRIAKLEERIGDIEGAIANL